MCMPVALIIRKYSQFQNLSSGTTQIDMFLFYVFASPGLYERLEFVMPVPKTL